MDDAAEDDGVANRRGSRTGEVWECVGEEKEGAGPRGDDAGGGGVGKGSGGSS